MIKILPKIYYDLSLRNENPIPVIIPDLLTRIKIKMTEQDKKLMLFDYMMTDGETLESVSLKFYNTQDYHWTIMYINERYDYIADFPIQYESLESYCQSKYGAENVWNVHHYEDDDGNISDEYVFDWKNQGGGQPTGIPAETPVWRDRYQYSEIGTDWVQLRTKPARAITNFEYEDQINESKRMIKLIKAKYIGQFVQEYEKALKAIND